MATRTKSAGLRVESSSSASTTAKPASSGPSPGQAVQRTEPEQQLRGDNFSARNAFEILYWRARESLSSADLEAIAVNSAEQAEDLARYAAKVADGLAFLIVADGDLNAPRRPGAPTAGPVGAGNFQSSSDVPQLLHHLAGQFRHIEALAGLSCLAAGDLAERGQG